jgi:GTP-binding protein
LIEGAAEGIGLGHEFLRHIERTRLVIHLLDGSGGLEGRDPLDDFRAINEELAAYSPELASKPQIVAINKVDLVETRDNLDYLTELLSGEGHEVFPISAATGQGVSELLHRTMELVRELPAPQPIAPQQHRVYTMETANEEHWEAEQLSRHHFEVRGPKIERMTKMTDFANEEAADRYQRILESSGISARLEELGVEPGDIVHVADYELIWDQASLMAEEREAARRKRRTKRERLAKRSGFKHEFDEGNSPEAG